MPLADPDAFWRHVDRCGEDECWPWLRATTQTGYGMYLGTTAHRTAYNLTHEPHLSPEQLCLHRCDNPPCCNPRHLFAGTGKDNVADCRAKGRLSKGPIRADGLPLSAKLTAYEAADRIREEYASTHTTQRALAVKYGISPSAVSLIVLGKRWKVNQQPD